jgi:hypothetical protein
VRGQFCTMEVHVSALVTVCCRNCLRNASLFQYLIDSAGNPSIPRMLGSELEDEAQSVALDETLDISWHKNSSLGYGHCPARIRPVVLVVGRTSKRPSTLVLTQILSSSS